MSDFFWSNLFGKQPSETDIITRYWLETPLFKGIPKKHVEQLAENMHIRDYQTDEAIFKQGDQGAGAILVLTGEVEVMASEHPLAKLEAGDFFGEITLAETEERTAHATCRAPSRLVFFLKQDLEEWIDVEPRLGAVFLMNLSSTLAQRLHKANQLLAER